MIKNTLSMLLNTFMNSNVNIILTSKRKLRNYFFLIIFFRYYLVFLLTQFFVHYIRRQHTFPHYCSDTKTLRQNIENNMTWNYLIAYMRALVSVLMCIRIYVYMYIQCFSGFFVCLFFGTPAYSWGGSGPVKLQRQLFLPASIICTCRYGK